MAFCGRCPLLVRESVGGGHGGSAPAGGAPLAPRRRGADGNALPQPWRRLGCGGAPGGLWPPPWPNVAKSTEGVRGQRGSSTAFGLRRELVSGEKPRRADVSASAACVQVSGRLLAGRGGPAASGWPPGGGKEKGGACPVPHPPARACESHSRASGGPGGLGGWCDVCLGHLCLAGWF